MADKHPLRQYLMFRALIARVPDPVASVDRILESHPEWDPEEKKTWEAWKADELPDIPKIRVIDTVEVPSQYL